MTNRFLCHLGDLQNVVSLIISRTILLKTVGTMLQNVSFRYKGFSKTVTRNSRNSRIKDSWSWNDLFNWSNCEKLSSSETKFYMRRINKESKIEQHTELCGVIPLLHCSVHFNKGRNQQHRHSYLKPTAFLRWYTITLKKILSNPDNARFARLHTIIDNN